jgi:hypothetical protein
MEHSSNHNCKGRKGFFFLFAIAALFAISAVVMFLWNATLPGIFNIPAINYWQAMLIFFLSKILFGGFRFGRNYGHHQFFEQSKMREKFLNMSEEEKQAFKQEWKSRCHLKGKE